MKHLFNVPKERTFINSRIFASKLYKVNNESELNEVLTSSAHHNPVGYKAYEEVKKKTFPMFVEVEYVAIFSKKWSIAKILTLEQFLSYKKELEDKLNEIYQL